MADTLRKRATRGVAWTAISRVIQIGTQLGSTFVLAHLLPVSSFGQLAMVTTVTGFAAVFAELGLASAIVQEEKPSQVELTSIFFFNIVAGVLLAGCLYAASSALASFYRVPELRSITRAVCWSFALSGPAVVARALLIKEMRFATLARIEVTSSLVGGAIAIALALRGFGVWALIWSALTASAVSTVATFVACRWKPSLFVSLARSMRLVRYGAWLTGSQAINYWIRNADNLLVGRVLGATALGLYSRSYMLMLLPINQIIGVVSNVMFSALSSIKNDTPRVASVYIRTVSAIAAVSFPTMIGLAIVANSFVDVFFGSAWMGMVRTLRIMCPIGVIQSTLNPAGWLFTSQGRTNTMFRLGVGTAVPLLAAFAVGVWLGSIEAVAWCYLAVNIAIWPLELWFAGRLVNLQLRDFIGAFRAPLLASAAMGMGVAFLDCVILSPHITSTVRLAADVSVGVVLYLAIATLSRMRALQDLLETVRKRNVQSNPIASA